MRNIVLHGGNYTTSKVILDVEIHEVESLNTLTSPSTWPQLIALLDGFSPEFSSKWVKWYPPPWGGRNVIQMGLRGIILDLVVLLPFVSETMRRVNVC